MINNYYQSWKRSKYGSRKAECAHGHVHDSQREACRCNELHILQYCGELTDLQIQRKYVLIPTIRESTGEYYTRGPQKGQEKPGKVIEQECAYYADFDYITKGGKHIVEDTKGMRTKEYIIKRKLMLYRYGIRIVEV